MNNITKLLIVIKTEFLKLKRCKVLWCIPICSLFPDIIVYILYGFNKKHTMLIWEDYFTNAEMLINILVGIGFFSLLAGFIYSREYQENTVNSIFTYPISRLQFFAGKLIVMFVLISITIISSFILLVFLGFTISHEPLLLNVLLYYAKTYLLTIIMQFSLIPIAAMLSIHNKNIIPSIILAVSVISVNFILMNTKFNALFPWSVPIMLSPHEGGRSYTNYTVGITVLCLTFIIGTILSIIGIKKDVH